MLDPRLSSAIEIADRHARILSGALDDLRAWLPLSVELLAKDDPQLVRLLDQIQSRFTKLQDHLGARLFPSVLDALAEDPRLPMIDRLDLLEKLGFLDSADSWHALRVIRNRMAHDYPDAPEVLVAELGQAIHSARDLLGIWSSVRERMFTRPALRAAMGLSAG